MLVDTSALLENRAPIAANDPRYRPLLADLQGNILSAHGKSNADYYFIKFRADEEGLGLLKAKYLIGMLSRNAHERASVINTLRSSPNLLPDALQTALAAREGNGAVPLLTSIEQCALLKDLRIGSELESCQRYAGQGKAATFAVNFMLSRSGYRKLLAALPDPAFNEGLAARWERLNDPDVRSDPSLWDKPYDDADALLIAAYDPLPASAGAQQQRCSSALAALLEEHTDVIAREAGVTFRARGERIEPFGFRDGLSQPQFYASAAGRRHPTSEWRDFAPLATVLLPDPHGRTPHACGSYFVFRKLQQDVGRFHRQVREVAKALGRDWHDVLSETVGRRLTGEPLAGVDKGAHNDFDFRDDQRATRCPGHAHISKVNPRGDVKSIYDGKRRRIVRRGLSFGPELMRDANGLPRLDGDKVVPKDKARADEATGTLFVCAQASIEEQFEHIQAHWANNPTHPNKRMPGADAIAGRLPTGETNRMAMRDAAGERNFVEFAAHVTMRGGGYFFAPSISYLAALLDDLWT